MLLYFVVLWLCCVVVCLPNARTIVQRYKNILYFSNLSVLKITQSAEIGASEALVLSHCITCHTCYTP